MGTLKSKLLKVLLAIFLVAILLALGENLYFRKRVPLGVYIGQNYIGGKTYKELEGFLEEISTALGKGKLKLYVSGEVIPLVFTLEEMGIKLQKERIMEEIIALHAPFNYMKNIMLYLNGHPIPGYFTVDENSCYSLLGPVREERYVPPQDARIWAEEGKLKFRPHKKGVTLKLEQLPDKIINELYYWPSLPLTIKIEKECLYPEVTISRILSRGITGEIAKASTYFDSTAANRAHNITLAAKKIDNTLLPPEEFFSFNQIVGEAGLEDGFKEAPVIVNERVVMGPGGGICQVSSTIYNAALRAGLSIVERHNHGLPVGYLPPGYDAAVSYSYKDLKFKNNTPFHILIHMQVLNNELRATFFGDHSRTRQVKIITQSLQTIAPPIHYREIKDQPPSYRKVLQEGKPGYIAETIRIFYENEEELYREQLGRDYYAPTPEIYAVGVLPEG